VTLVYKAILGYRGLTVTLESSETPEFKETLEPKGILGSRVFRVIPAFKERRATRALKATQVLLPLLISLGVILSLSIRPLPPQLLLMGTDTSFSPRELVLGRGMMKRSPLGMKAILSGPLKYLLSVGLLLSLTAPLPMKSIPTTRPTG
jgi:hypothetical protein